MEDLSNSTFLRDLLRQRSRPYLFSNTVMPSIAATTLEALDLVMNGNELRQTLQRNSDYFREKMTLQGFNLVPGNHPIIPVMLGDAALAQEFAKRLLQHGIYVIGFSFPVVPKGLARIRTQMSAGHTLENIDQCIAAFITVGKELGVIETPAHNI